MILLLPCLVAMGSLTLAAPPAVDVAVSTSEETSLASLDEIYDSPCFGTPESDADKDALIADLPDVSDLPWPSYEELFGPDSEGPEDLFGNDDEGVCFNSTAADSPALRKRYWTSPNEIQFYMRRYPESCDGRRPTCVGGWSNVIALRDSCYSDVCGSGIQRVSYMEMGSMCHREFRACRVRDANWRLVIRDVNRAGLDRVASCRRGADLFSNTARNGWRHKPYGTLVDAANGREVGWCYVQDNHSYSRFCGGRTVTMRSLVRCGWFGHGIWWPFKN